MQSMILNDNAQWKSYSEEYLGTVHLHNVAEANKTKPYNLMTYTWMTTYEEKARKQLLQK